MSQIDSEALDAANAPSVRLFEDFITVRGPHTETSGVEELATGITDVDRVFTTVTATRVWKKGGQPTLTIELLQAEDDEAEPSSAGSHTFTGDGRHVFTVDDPLAVLSFGWEVSAQSGWRVTVDVGFASINAPGSEGGGSQAHVFTILDADDNPRGIVTFDDDQLELRLLDEDGEPTDTRYYSGDNNSGLSGNRRIDFDLQPDNATPAGHTTMENTTTGGLGTALVLHAGGIGGDGQLNIIYGNQDPTAPDVEFNGPDPYDFGVNTLYAQTGATAALWFQTESLPPTWVNLTP